MPKIINVPIEPLEERYSAQWNRWIPEELKRLGVAFEHLDWVTPVSGNIRQGSFLDIIGTNCYKARQLEQLCLMIERGSIAHGDVILLNDIWFPGIEMLAYIRDALHIDFKIAGIAHAGTWDPWDFLSQKHMGTWAENLENSWFEIVDYVLVNGHYHAELLNESRKVDPHKIWVVGYPFRPNEFVVPDHPKENIVVFPHRLDPEKDPDKFLRLADDLRFRNPGWQFIRTKDVWTDKKSYYELLNRSKVAFSCALQETFGIAMVEATLCGCVPVVPNRLSYQYLYEYGFRYRRDEEIETNLEYAMICWSEDSIQSMLKRQQAYFRTEASQFMERIINIVFNKKADGHYKEWQKNPFRK